MKKERMFWARKDIKFYATFYYFYTTPQKASHFGCDYIFQLCASEIDTFTPKLKLRKGQICEYKLTQLKNGIKLEKVGKPIKG